MNWPHFSRPAAAEPNGAAATSGGTFRAFGVRNFRLFFTGQLISQIGNWLTLIAQTLLVLEITDSGIALGGLAAAQFGPVLLLGAFAGVLADRSDKRRLLITVQVLAMGQSMLLAAMAIGGHPPLWAVYAVAVLGGIATAFDNPARRSFVVEMVPADMVTNAVSLNSAVMTGARIVGPALAGLLVATLGFSWAFFIDGLSYIAVIVGLVKISTAELRPAPVTPRGRGQIREGVRYAWGLAELRIPLVMMGVVGLLAFNFQTVLPLFVTRDLGGSDLTFTVLMSVTSVGSLVGALVAARRTLVTVSMVIAAALGFGVAMAALAVMPNVPAALVAGMFMGGASISFMSMSTAIVQIEADPRMRGRVLALQSILFLGSTPIGGPIVGFISEQFGARWGIAIGAAACFGAVGYALTSRRRSEALRLRPDPATAALADAIDASTPGASSTTPAVSTPAAPTAALLTPAAETLRPTTAGPTTAGRTTAGPTTAAPTPAGQTSPAGPVTSTVTTAAR